MTTTRQQTSVFVDSGSIGSTESRRRSAIICVLEMIQREHKSRVSYDRTIKWYSSLSPNRSRIVHVSSSFPRPVSLNTWTMRTVHVSYSSGPSIRTRDTGLGYISCSRNGAFHTILGITAPGLLFSPKYQANFLVWTISYERPGDV